MGTGNSTVDMDAALEIAFSLALAVIAVAMVLWLYFSTPA